MNHHFTCLTAAERQQLLQHFLAANKPLDEQILASLERVLDNAFADYRELSLIRIDLRFAQAELQPDMPVCFQHTDPQVITRFIASLKSQLSEQARRKQSQGIRTYPCRLRYLWVLEQHKSALPHYHLILVLNKDAHAFLGKVDGNQSAGLIRLIQEAWCRALGLAYDMHCSLANVSGKALTHLSREDVQARSERYWDWLYRACYLTKLYTKFTGAARRTFGASQG